MKNLKKGTKTKIRSITIQPLEGANFQRPYPYHIKPNGLVERQDFWKGNPYRLLGFSLRPVAGSIDITRKEFFEKPESILSMFPVFASKDKEWYTSKIYITEFHINQ